MKNKIIITSTPKGSGLSLERLIEDMEYNTKSRKIKFIREIRLKKLLDE